MRGIPSLITDIRKKVFTEAARMACAGTLLPVEQAAKIVGSYQKEAATATPSESPFHDLGHTLEQDDQ